jgi:hypothetical protein
MVNALPFARILPLHMDTILSNFVVIYSYIFILSSQRIIYISAHKITQHCRDDASGFDYFLLCARESTGFFQSKLIAPYANIKPVYPSGHMFISMSYTHKQTPKDSGPAHNGECLAFSIISLCMELANGRDLGYYQPTSFSCLLPANLFKYICYIFAFIL